MIKLRVNGVGIEIEDGLDVEINGDDVVVRRGTAHPSLPPGMPTHPYPRHDARPFWQIPDQRPETPMWEPLRITC